MSDKKKRKSKPYFPNNYEKVRNCPSEWFPPVSFDEFMDWKIGGYEIPSSINCIIREKNLRTGKVKEYVYQRPTAAKNKCIEIMDIGESEFIVCNSDEIHYMYPNFTEDYDDPLA